MAQVRTALKQAFNTAITRIYFFTLFIVAAGFLFTWFIPEIPLKKSNEAPEPAVVS